MSMHSERIEGKLITIRTPVMVRRIMIWDMEASGPLGDTMDVLRMDGAAKRQGREDVKDMHEMSEGEAGLSVPMEKRQEET